MRKPGPIRYVGFLCSNPIVDLKAQLTFTSVKEAAQFLRVNGVPGGDVLILQRLEHDVQPDDWAPTPVSDDSFGWHSPFDLTLGPRGGVSGGGL